jgi:hypothetical protein
MALGTEYVYHVSGSPAPTACGSNWSLLRTPKNGGTTIVLASAQGCPEWMAVDGAAIYWLNSQTGEGDETGEVDGPHTACGAKDWLFPV